MNIEELLDKIPEDLRTTVAMLNNRVAYLVEENNTLKRKLYARNSEILKDKYFIIEPKENCIFNEVEQLIIDTPETVEETLPKVNTQPEKESSPQKNKGGRKPLPLDLPREEIVHDLPTDKKVCPNDGTELKKIGEERVEKLEYIPAQFKVIVDIYPKYACPTCESYLAKERAVPSVIPGAICKPGLLATVILFKYRLGLPLYRIEDMLTGFDINIPRVTLARWAISAAKFLTPLTDLLKEHILAKQIIHADETPIQVLKGTGKSPQTKTYMWTICTGEYETPIVYYEYHTSRSQKAAESLLGNFAGFLHVDGYEGYNKITNKPEVTEVNCFAHARRMFFEAYKDGAAHGKSVAKIFLDKIHLLFKSEKEWKELTTEERYLRRQEFSLPILSEIKNLIVTHHHKVPQKSKLGKALTYTLNQWEGLSAFVKHGDLSLSNNRMENFIRPFVIGRKGWLFSDTVAGAEASAKLYSLVITAKENNCDLFAYFKYLFETLPGLMDDITPKELEEFLPWNYQKKISSTDK